MRNALTRLGILFILSDAQKNVITTFADITSYFCRVCARVLVHVQCVYVLV